jgi:hypothetical protein
MRRVLLLLALLGVLPSLLLACGRARRGGGGGSGDDDDSAPAGDDDVGDDDDVSDDDDTPNPDDDDAVQGGEYAGETYGEISAEGLPTSLPCSGYAEFEVDGAQVWGSTGCGDEAFGFECVVDYSGGFGATPTTMSCPEVGKALLVLELDGEQLLVEVLGSLETPEGNLGISWAGTADLR